MRGRRPTPTHLKLLKNSNPQRINKNEPALRKMLPSPPAELSEGARNEWDRVAEELYRAGLLTNVDRAVLAAYCQMHARWAEAERGVKEIGLTVVAGNGTTIPNPLVGIANKAASDMVKYAAEFGLSPSSRSRLCAVGLPDDFDPAVERYFRDDDQR